MWMMADIAEQTKTLTSMSFVIDSLDKLNQKNPSIEFLVITHILDNHMRWYQFLFPSYP